MKQLTLIMIILIVAGLVLAGAGILMQKSAPADQGKSIVAEGWTNPTKPTVQDWSDLANNVTHTWSMIATNRSQITDATTANISASSANAIAASSTNISALRGNGTVVMNNGTAVPYYNLTTSYAQITVTGSQSLNFTTASAGTYLITANIRENTTLTAPQTTVFTQYALCDAYGTTIVPNSERMGSRVQDTGNFSAVARSFSWIYTNSTGASEVGICAKISSAVAGRYAVASDADGRSVMNYVRLP